MSNEPFNIDDVWLSRIAEGDQNAFSLLFDRYKGPIYSTILRLTDSPEVAEEVLQDVFLKIWIRRGDLSGIKHFAPYLHTIAKRDAYRALKALATEKKTTRGGIGENEERLHYHLDLEQEINQKEYEALLIKAIAHLPQRQQQTFLLIRKEGLKREAAADIMHISPETIKYHLEEAMRKIRAFFLANGYPLKTFYLALLYVIKTYI